MFSTGDLTDTVDFLVSRRTATGSVAAESTLGTLDLVLARVSDVHAVETDSFNQDLLLSTAGLVGGTAQLGAGDTSLAGVATGTGALSDSTTLWFTGDSDEGHGVVGTTSRHSAALELVVGVGKLTEIAGGTVLRSSSTDTRRIGGLFSVGNLVVRASESSNGLGRGDRGGSAALVTLIGQGPLTTVSIGTGSIGRIEGVTRGDLIVLHEDVLVGRAAIRDGSNLSLTTVSSSKLVLCGLTAVAVRAGDEGSDGTRARHLGVVLQVEFGLVRAEMVSRTAVSWKILNHHQIVEIPWKAPGTSD